MAVRVQLSVREGKGFIEPTRGSTYVLQASLEGRRVTRGPLCCDGGHQPCFDQQLTWQVGRAELRRMRAQCKPVRLECFAVEPCSGRRRRLGFALLGLRSARVRKDARSAAAKDSYRWLQLHGSGSAPTPTLAVRLSLVSERPSPRIEQCVESSVDCQMRVVERGRVSAGAVEPPHVPALVVTFKLEAAYNLELLRAEANARDRDSAPCRLALAFLGLDVWKRELPGRPLDVAGAGPIILNERVAVRLEACSRAALSSLLKRSARGSASVARLVLSQRGHALADAELLRAPTDAAMLARARLVRAGLESDCELRGMRSGRVPRTRNGRAPFVTVSVEVSRLPSTLRSDRVNADVFNPIQIELPATA